MRSLSKVLHLIGVTFTLVLAAQAADATGKWKGEFDTQVGVQKYAFELKVDGENLTGKAFFERMNQKGEAELQEGKVKGTEIFFVEKFSIEGNEIRIEYKGKVTGDEINFTRRVGDFATEQFLAKRAKD